VDNATFPTISAFANAGLTLTSDNLIGLSHNSCAYALLTFVIVVGNTVMPIFLRLLVSLLLRVETQLVARFHPHYVPVNSHGGTHRPSIRPPAPAPCERAFARTTAACCGSSSTRFSC
jgi:hypothetical protein